MLEKKIKITEDYSSELARTCSSAITNMPSPAFLMCHSKSVPNLQASPFCDVLAETRFVFPIHLFSQTHSGLACQSAQEQNQAGVLARRHWGSAPMAAQAVLWGTFQAGNTSWVVKLHLRLNCYLNPRQKQHVLKPCISTLLLEFFRQTDQPRTL